jgi:hypothetical protein
MMTAWEAPEVQQLLADERVGLSGFPHADAFVALYPFLNKVVVSSTSRLPKRSARPSF